MNISNRTEFDAALKRQADLQREGSSDPEKQRELREVSEKLDAYRRSNPAAAKGVATPRSETEPALGAPAEDKSGVHDPHNELNLNIGPPGLNDQTGTTAPAPIADAGRAAPPAAGDSAPRK